MAAPTRVQSNAIAYSARASGTAGTTATFNVLNGDLLTVRGMSEGNTVSLTISDNTGGALTWTQRVVDSTASHCWIAIWTAPVAADRTGVTVSLTQSSGATQAFGGRCTTWRSHGGVGTSNKATGTTAPSVSLTGVGANSAIDAECGDFSASAAAGTWGGSATATSETATLVSGRATFYEAFYADAGSAGNKTVSMSGITGGITTIAALEILASAGGGSSTPDMLASLGVG